MTARASASPSATESASSSACSWEQGCRPVRPPSRRARGASPRSSVGSSSRSDLRRQEMRAGGLEILRRPLLSVRERARLPTARRCVCGPPACCRGGGAGAARRGEAAAPWATNYLGARVPSCGSPRARPPRAAVCGPAACGRRCGGAAAQASAAAVLEAIAWAAPPPRCRAVRAAPLRMWPRNGSLRRLSASVRVCVATGAKYHASAVSGPPKIQDVVVAPN